MIKYYLPIDSKCLSHYYSYACIAPSCYYYNRPKDIQNKFDQYLLLTRRLGCPETDCCLELIMTSEEEKSLVRLNNDWFVFETPIPISRVRKIIFSSQAQMETTLSNIRLSTAFIPSGLGEVVDRFENNSSNGLKLPEDPIAATPHSENLKKFNSILGALALMNVSREKYMNYSDNFFETFSFFNNFIYQNLIDVKKVVGQSFSTYFDETTKLGFATLKLRNHIGEDAVMKMAELEKQEIVKNKITRVIDLSLLKKWTYIYAFLSQYGVGGESKKKKIDSLIINNFKSKDLLEKPSVDSLALLYGYNRGYNVFNNAYGTDPNSKIDVKFRMESLLDHYIIESVYQYVFYKKIADSAFSYIDEWCPKLNVHKSLKSTDYQILDVVVIGKKKAPLFSSEYWTGFFQRFSNERFWNALQELCGVDQFKTQMKELVQRIYGDVKEELEDKFSEQLSEYKAIIQSKDKEIISLKEDLSNFELTKKEVTIGEKETMNLKCGTLLPYEQNQSNDLFSVSEDVDNRNGLDIDSVLVLYERYSHLTAKELREELSMYSVKSNKKDKKGDLLKTLIKLHLKNYV